MRQRRRLFGLVLAGCVLTQFALTAPALTQTIGAPVPGASGDYEKPNQNRAFYYNGEWWLAAPTLGKWHLWKKNGSTWTQSIQFTDNEKSRPDCYLDDQNGKLYIFISHTSRTLILRLSYVEGSWTPDKGFPVEIPDFDFSSGNPASFTRDTQGVLWAFLISASQLVSINSADDGFTWSQHAAIKTGLNDDSGLTDAVRFKIAGVPYVGVVYAENTSPNSIYGFLYHKDGDASAAWVDETGAITQFFGTEADDHISAISDTSGNIYVVTKTDGGGSTVASNGFLKRDAAGWHTFHLNNDDGWTRPTVAYDETNEEIYAFGTFEGDEIQPGTGVYKKVKRGQEADFLSAPTVVVFQNGVDEFRDLTVSAKSTDHSKNILVALENRTQNQIWYNEIDVTRFNKPPDAVASGSPTFGKTPLVVNFLSDGSSDLDGKIVSYNWNFGDGGTSTLPNSQHTYTQEGTFNARLIVLDNEGKSDSAFVTITTVHPIPPTAVASATPTSGKVSLQVQFTGSGSTDPDGQIASYFWTFGDGAVSSSADPSHTYTTPGNYTAELVVTDSDGLKDTATIAITVNALQAPTAVVTASPVSGSTLTTFSFSGAQSTDGDGSIVTYAWDFGDGAGSSAVAEPTYQFASAGNYTVALTVTDDDGLQGSATVQISVAAPQAPVAVASVDNANANTLTVLQFTGSNSTDADGQIVGYEWDFGDGIGTSTQADPTYQYSSGGNFTAQLTVTDNDGLKNTAAINITMQKVVKPVAVATATPDSGDAPLEVQFSGSTSSDEDGTIASYNWDFGDGTGASVAADPVYTYPNKGVYNARLIVTDNDGISDTAFVEIKVFFNFAPDVAIHSPAQDTTIMQGHTLFFSGEANDAEDGTLPSAHFIWSLIPDQGAPTVISTNVKSDIWTFSESGDYILELKAHDNLGLFAADSIFVTVSPPTSVQDDLAGPNQFRLHEAYPNPFSASSGASGVQIRFSLPKQEAIFVGVYNALGQLVRELQVGDKLGQGSHSLEWDGRDANRRIMPVGLYFLRLRAGKFAATRKIILIR